MTNSTMSHKQFAILAALFCGASTPAEVIALAGIPHACEAIDGLEARGLVETDVDDSHRYVDLTPAGAKLARTIFCA